MHPFPFTRRHALQSAAAGFGYLAFAGTAARAAEKSNPLAPRTTHFPAKAKHVIFLCMEGAPSHVDTFDYKPKLASLDGQSMPKARTFAKLMASPFKFNQHGKNGLWISELFPQLAKQADELCLLRGMHTDVPAHPQAFTQLHTGIFQARRPSLGAWALYGLGTENENLPGFVSISPPLQNGGPANYGSAFLPAMYQGTPVGTSFRPISGASVSNIKNPKQTTDAQRMQIDFIQSLNREALERDPNNAAIEGAIESYELAFRMQRDLPKLMDTANEPKEIRSLYGVGETGTDNFGRQCLLARRFVEAGVRFVEVCSNGWDHHRNLKTDLATKCTSIDKPIAGLLQDLKVRGLLKDTLILWGGEFGRTPYGQGGDGRDHNHKGFTMWMAGGGVKGGYSHGQTDDFGYEAVENKVHIHDGHATILHLLGMDHEKLTFRYAGREMRLTDVKGNVVKEIVA
ncbi:MAG: DUF1501 domain-containing protein [Planctomycetes bacterium]|nr:DUF1501 domain-containing protein [Planctomycetota bacterium]